LGVSVFSFFFCFLFWVGGAVGTGGVVEQVEQEQIMAGSRRREFAGLFTLLLMWSLGVVVHEDGVVEATTLGVNWGTRAFNPLPNSIVVKMLQDNQITRVKLFDANPGVIKSMAGTNIEVMVAASNDELSSLAANPAAAAAWVRDNVTQYLASNNNGVNIK
jgi:hypothetical protein